MTSVYGEVLDRHRKEREQDIAELQALKIQAGDTPTPTIDKRLQQQQAALAAIVNHDDYKAHLAAVEADRAKTEEARKSAEELASLKQQLAQAQVALAEAQASKSAAA